MTGSRRIMKYSGTDIPPLLPISDPYCTLTSKPKPTMKLKEKFMMLAVALLPGVVSACPPGSVLQKGNGWEGCIGGTDTPSAPAWEKRWGALALDDSTGSSGASSKERTQAKAEKKALSICTKRGGTACRIEISYHNQCISFVTGKSRYFVRADYTLDQAVASSIERCEKEDNDCKVAYSSCSLPERSR